MEHEREKLVFDFVYDITSLIKTYHEKFNKNDKKHELMTGVFLDGLAISVAKFMATIPPLHDGSMDEESMSCSLIEFNNNLLQYIPFYFLELKEIRERIRESTKH